MLRCSSLVRICILANLTVSSYRGLLSRPFFLASVDIAISLGNMLANCFFCCGVMLGATPFASFSNSALVMTVLQSVAEVFAAGTFGAASDFAAAALVAAALGVAGQTPCTVMTAASSGTDADMSGGAAGACIGCAGGALGAACPQARAPSRTHRSQLLRISHFLQGLVHQKVGKFTALKS